jgi:hypothetical protein
LASGVLLMGARGARSGPDIKEVEMRHGKRGLLVVAMAYGLALAGLPAGMDPGLAGRDSGETREAAVTGSPAGAILSEGGGQGRLMLAGGTGVGNPGTTKRGGTGVGNPGTTKGR